MSRAPSTGPPRTTTRPRAERGQLPEPAQALVVRNRGVGWRSRRQHEETRRGEPPLLEPERGALPIDALIRCLAHEGEDARLQILRNVCQPLGRPREVAAS